MTNIAIENGPVEIVDFPIENGGSFHSKMLVHQRVPNFQTPMAQISGVQEARGVSRDAGFDAISMLHS